MTRFEASLFTYKIYQVGFNNFRFKMFEQRNCIGCDEEPGKLLIKSSVLFSKMFMEVTGLCLPEGKEFYLVTDVVKSGNIFATDFTLQALLS